MEENIIKVVHCKTKDIFNQRFAEINVSPEEKDENPYYYYVIIIQDTGEVYTHGKIINSDTLNKLKTLIGNDSDKSARKIAEEEVSKVIDNAPEMYDTLQEIAAWIEEHGDEVTEINNGITTNAQNISTISKHIAWNATDIIPNYKYYITKSEFIAEHPDYQNENSVVYNDIVYVHNVKEIYTHGRFYNEYATFDYTEFEGDDDVYVSEYVRQTSTIASIINNYGIIPVQIKNGESFLGIGVATIYIDTKSTVKNILCKTVWLDNWTDSENQKHVIFKAEYNEDGEVRYELIQKDYVFANHKTSHLIAQELTVNDQKLRLDGSIDTYVKGNGTLGKINEFLASDGVAKFANDLTGRNEATAEEFTLRPSAGNKSIRDDSATIKRIKGNSVVFNQMISTPPVVPYTNRCNLSISGNDINATVNSIEYSYVGFYYSLPDNRHPKTVNGHTYFISGLFSCPKRATIAFGVGVSATQQLVPANTLYSYNCIQKQTSDTVGAVFTCWIEDIQVGDTFKVQNWNVIDLTQMFGVGNEPDTVEEFRALFPGNRYEYNPGQLVSMTANGLFTNGFNQWDEEWESGVYKYWSDGLKSDSSEYIRSTNFIKVIPTNTYCLNIAQGVDAGVGFYDENNNFLGQASYSYRDNYRIFQVPANCQKITFYTKATTYNNDICINLSHTGVENGKYEPYWNATKDLSIIQKYFPNGMRSAGSIYDEISFDETTQKWVAIQRVGNVDLGSLSWAYSEHLFGGETVAGFKTSIEDVIFTNAATTLPNITVSKYNINTADKVANGHATTETFTGYKAYKTDLSAHFTFTTDAAAFKSALAGVILNYELAEPIITVIEEPVNLSYKVGDFGIEQTLSDSFSAPFRADIIYQFNATDRIRENSLNIEKLSKTQNEYLLLAGGTMSGQINSQDIKPVEDSTYQLGDSTHKYDNVFSNFFTGNLEGNAKTATDLTGRIEATPEVFTYRPSAGDKSIKDDNAFIRRVKGNSVVWNQLSQVFPYDNTRSTHGVSATNISGTHYIECSGTTTAIEGDSSIYVDSDITPKIKGVIGHKYLFLVEGCRNLQIIIYSFISPSKKITNGGTIVTCTANNYVRYTVSIPTSTPVGTTINEKIRVLYIDLTQMFGAGNEPTTVEEFRALYPDSYYPYNPGELRNLDCSGIKTVGFNQWDEQWEVGQISSTNGNVVSGGNKIISKNYIPVLPNTSYYLTLPLPQDDSHGVYYYDGNKNYIGYLWIAKDVNQQLFTTPSNCLFIKFDSWGTTYNNDICINLHHTGYRDGEYEPYKEVIHALPLSKITNGEPLRKAGSVYDEINETEYIKRVGVVDLGSYDWYETPNGTFNTTVSIPDIKAVELESNYTCQKYIGISNPSDIYAGTTDNLTISTNGVGRIYIRDDAYKTGTAYAAVPALKASLSGVLLHYELAEPIITPIETPLNLDYQVEDFGTEEAILAEHSTPFRADIVYQFNATDRIRENSLNIEKLSKTQKDYLPLTGGTMSGQVNSQDIKPVEGSTYQLGDSTYKYKNVFSNFFTGNLEGNAKTATVATDLSGRVEATPEVFTYRPSAGEKSIKDDNAFIRRVKGNSIAWNQQLKTLFSPNITADTVTSNGITFTRLSSGGYNISGSNNTSDIAMSNNTVANLELQAGHKYIIIPIGLNKSAISFYGPSSGVSSFVTADARIITPTNSASVLLRSVVQAGVIDVNETIYCNVHDLTQMSSAGNEPTTVEEFRELYPDSYYPYNTGELRNLVCNGIKTVGFNQWDEQWEKGSINQDGGNTPSTTMFRSVGYMQILQQKYCVKQKEGQILGLRFYDENKVHISGGNRGVEGTITTLIPPPNAAYMRFVCTTSNTYNNDICINLHHTGWRDGDYEPYKEVTHSLPLSQITNGEPLRKAGSVYDEINETEYIKRVGVVDLGSLAWINAANNIFACTEMPNMIVTTDVASRLDGLLCTKYAIDTTPSIDATMSDKTMKRKNGWLYIKDTSFTDVASFKASLSGVLLHYELAEPIVTPIETPIDFNYYVEDFGTEEALLAEDSAPFSADIIYQFNATDQIRNNTRNINKLQKSALIPKGTSAQYIRGDGSYGNVLEFTQAIPINDGEYEMPDAIHQFILTPNYYAKSPVELDNTTTVTVYVTPPEDSNYLAEYWFEFKTGEVLPDITFTSSTEDTKFRIAGDMLGDAVNILHLISSDGGMTFFGEMKHYIL